MFSIATELILRNEVPLPARAEGKATRTQATSPVGHMFSRGQLPTWLPRSGSVALDIMSERVLSKGGAFPMR